MIAQNGGERKAAVVHEALAGLGIHDLRVDVVGACVYLRGIVSSFEAKRLAEGRAHVVAAGAHVSNRLRVAVVSTHSRSHAAADPSVAMS